MTLSELSKAILCLVLAHYAAPIKWASSAVAIWYLTQAADEAMNRNIFKDSLWEYPLLAAFLLLAYKMRKA
jgi:dipeptide/tripeptide permease